MGQRSPQPAELKALQDACAGDMNMMRHCRQCRADAVGLLGEDRGAEFTLDKIDAMEVDYEAAMVRTRRVARADRAELAAKRARAHAPAATATPQVISSSRTRQAGARPRPAGSDGGGGQNGLVAVHFGHAREFLVYEASASGARLVGHRKARPIARATRPVAMPRSVLEKTIRALADCEVVLCSRIGYEPWGQLEAAGIQPNGEYAMQPIEDAVMAVWNEMLAAGKLAVGPIVAKRA
jgi:nitrogen fixation protein NifB